jgi:hypothetical protein
MAHATENLQITAPLRAVASCGSCTYVYNSTDGCYHRQSFGCTSNCTCSPIVCGLGSQLIQFLRPDSVGTSVAVALPCSSAGSDEEWRAHAIIGAIRGVAAAATFWRRVSLGLGVLSALLAIGLVVALVYR